MLPGVVAGVVSRLTATAVAVVVVWVGPLLQAVGRREVPDLVLVLQVLGLGVGAGGGGEEALVGHVGVAGEGAAARAHGGALVGRLHRHDEVGGVRHHHVRHLHAH